MKISNGSYLRYALLALIIGLTGAVATAQDRSTGREFCQNNNDSYSNDKVMFHELRETTLPATSLLTVDGRRNGGIKIIGSQRSDVLVRACVQAWGENETAARALAQNIRVETGSVIQANSATEDGWSVSYQIYVPRATNLKLSTYNGGIGIDGVEGNLEFEAHNGGVKLSDVAGNVRGRTTNGGLAINLSGDTWRGSGLNVETVNGGIRLILPETYRARVETGTVNGSIRSDIPGLSVAADERGRPREKRINADLNGGGTPIRIVTVNGGVKIGSSATER